jgi:DNA-directed RNA polymerase sigma subunit (sigma70/sigma32)
VAFLSALCGPKIRVLVSSWQNQKFVMCFLSDDDLRDLLCDPEIFPLFNLSKREQKVLIMHLVKGHTFKITGTVIDTSRQRAEQIYKSTKQKMKDQLPELLKNSKRNTS